MHSQPPQVLEFNYKLTAYRWMPIIPLTLGYRNRSLEFSAYVDSGAFYSLFDAEVASSLDLNLEQGKKAIFIVGDGKFLTARVFKIVIGIGSHSFVSDIAFSKELKVGFNLLGRKGIFDHFEEVIFQEKKRKILFKV